jgi:hypothetical protein
MHSDQQDKDRGRPFPGGCPDSCTPERIDPCNP